MNIKIENLSYIYSPNTPFSKVALEDINAEIKSGEFVGLIGHSGSGKSTFVQHINGLIKPTKGKITVGDWVLTNEKSDTKGLCFKVGLVFQYPEQQLFAETVFADIAFGPKNMGLSDFDISLRVKTAARLVGLSEDLFEKSPFSISGGQKRRVAIAGVIAMEPKILILDEPTAGLDPSGRDEILKSISKVHKEMDMTVILVSHSMEDVGKYCERLIVLNKGGIMLDGTKEQVFSETKKLQEIGLSAPQVTMLFEKLIEKGIIKEDIGKNIFTLEDAKKALLTCKPTS